MLCSDTYKVLFWKVMDFPRFILPDHVVKFANPEKFYIEKLLNKIEMASESMLALDAGAGPQDKKKFVVDKKYTYESLDFEDIFDQGSLFKQTYISSVDSMPMESETYDIILSIQVLEHLQNSDKALAEMSRVLKYGGKLFLSTNFLYPRHGSPYDYFRFTYEGLNSLCNNHGLKVISIESHGGFPAMCAQFFHELPSYFRNWILFGTTYPSRLQHTKKSRIPLLFIFILPIFLLNLITQLLAIVFASIDFFDHIKRFTLGYSLVIEKTKETMPQS